MANSPITKHKFDLEERTLEFAKNVIRLCRQLPQNVINNELIGQLIDSSGSVGANYREANDALSKKGLQAPNQNYAKRSQRNSLLAGAFDRGKFRI